MRKGIASLILCLSMIFFTTGMAYGSQGNSVSKVTYKGNAEKFVFIPIDTDLFQNFKNVMPGDSLVQKINIENQLSAYYNVNIYLRAEAINKDHERFLKSLSLKVLDGNGSCISEGTADLQAGLLNNVLLGSFPSGSSKEISVQLGVPTSMGNEFKNQVGLINWIFTAEEVYNPYIPVDPVDPEEPTFPENPDNPNEPDEPDKPDKPDKPDGDKPDKPDGPKEPGEKPVLSDAVQTGDESHIVLFGIFFLGSLSALVLIIKRFSNKKE
ncbi:MAG: sortase B protein-sorting domain-containing protein [Eubacteriales bacterium]|nr:sortase B protein-sorting domain-containing protein [Eubacteriales bacterium]